MGEGRAPDALVGLCRNATRKGTSDGRNRTGEADDLLRPVGPAIKEMKPEHSNFSDQPGLSLCKVEQGWGGSRRTPTLREIQNVPVSPPATFEEFRLASHHRKHAQSYVSVAGKSPVTKDR